MKDKIAEVSAAIGIAVVAQNFTHAGVRSSNLLVGILAFKILREFHIYS
jgi:hypothetical protein